MLGSKIESALVVYGMSRSVGKSIVRFVTRAKVDVGVLAWARLRDGSCVRHNECELERSW